jgi:putative N6-adenine-specific DNA methylase
VDSVVFSNEFRHSKFVAYKVKDAIVDQFREKTGDRPNIRIVNPDIKLHIHVAEYDCTLSLDSSGESLHRRGYRQEAVEAPLNEVLAAGIILQTGWRGECDLIDPMCGSGTFAIEAALIARGISPGVFRQEYAFEKWPDFDRELFDRIYEDDSNEHEFEHHIYAYDINRHAVEIASTNVKAAGLSKDITVAQQDFKDFKRPEQKSIMVMNPPYGERISSPDLLGLYKMIGERLKHQFHGNDAWVLSYREECFDQIGLRPSLRTPLFNGSLECELRKYQTFEGKFNEMRAQGGDIKTAVERRMMSEKKRFKQNRSFKKGLDEADDEMPVRNFGRDRRERKPFDRKPFERDGERRGGGERRGFRNDRNDRNDRNEGRREDRKDFRRENRRPRFDGAEKPRRSFDRKGPRPNNRKGNFNRFDNSNRFEDDED